MAITEVPVAVTGTQPEASPAPVTSTPANGSVVEKPQPQPSVWVEEQVHDAAGSFMPTEAEPVTVTPAVELEPALAPVIAEPELVVAPKPLEPEPQPIKTMPLDEHEREVERRGQAMLKAARTKWEREQAEAEKQRQDTARQLGEQQAKEQAEREEAELYRKWKAGDPDAEAQLVERYGQLLEKRHSEQERQTRQLLEEKESDTQRRMEAFAHQKWQEHAALFGADPDDERWAQVPANGGIRALNLALLKQAADEEVLAAVRENPKIQAWHDAEVALVRTALEEEHKTALATARQAAAADTQARLLGSGQVPKPDLSGSGGGQPITINEKLRAFEQSPTDPELLRWYREYRMTAQNV